MKLSRQIPIVLLLLLLPLLSWTTSTGGLPICCWDAQSCPMGHVACPMPGNGMSSTCAMNAAPQLSLPAPLMPLFPSLPSADGGTQFRPLVAAARAAFPAPASGWQPAIFHPPIA